MIGQDRHARQYAFSSLAGIAGYAKDGLQPTDDPEEMYARLRSRLADRGDHAAPMEHPLFEEYLSQKARELVRRS